MLFSKLFINFYDLFAGKNTRWYCIASTQEQMLD